MSATVLSTYLLSIKKKGHAMKLFQPPMYQSNIHSMLVPLSTEPLENLILRAAPQTGRHSEIRNLPNDTPENEKEVNIVIVKADKDWSSVVQWAMDSGLRRAQLRHVCSLAIRFPLLHQDLGLPLPLMAALATDPLRDTKGEQRIPLVWWTDGKQTNEVQHIASLFWKEEQWPHYYWYTFLRRAEDSECPEYTVIDHKETVMTKVENMETPRQTPDEKTEKQAREYEMFRRMFPDAEEKDGALVLSPQQFQWAALLLGSEDPDIGDEDL